MLYFKTEEAARKFALKTGHQYTDLGADAPVNRRFAVTIAVMAEE